MWVIFDNHEGTDKAMLCFYDNPEKQKELMHKFDIDEQVREWQKTNSGQPPIFRSRIEIKKFTNDYIRFSNI